MKDNVWSAKQILTSHMFISPAEISFYITACVTIIVYTYIGFTGSNPAHFFSGITGIIHADKAILLYMVSSFLMISMIVFFPGELSEKKKIITILFIALLIRFVLLPFEHSDDINRYLWEGKLVTEGLNPYINSPATFKGTDIALNDPFYALINHPENPAAYPPMMLLLFSLFSWSIYSAMALKVMIIGFDLLAVFLMIRVLQKKKHNIRWVFLYAANPLVLFAFAGQGHFEPIQIFLLSGALLTYLSNRWKTMYLLLGLAFQVKFVSLLVIPFFITRNNFKYFWICVGSALIFYLPFTNGNVTSLFSSIIKFGEEYAFNGSAHEFLRALSGDMKVATTFCKGLFIVFIVPAYFHFHPQLNRRYKGNPAAGSLAVMMILLLFSPTVHYWYLSWLFPFFIIERKKSIMVLFVSICFYFAVFDFQFRSGQWFLPASYISVEWLPFYCVLLVEVLFFLKGFNLKKSYGSVKTLSVIIPAFNEEERLRSCIKSAMSDPAVSEVIVADGGSSDRTLTIAGNHGADHVTLNKRPEEGGGRGGQILAGLKKSSGDIVVILHADTGPAPLVFSKVIEFLNENRRVSGGAIGSCFTAQGIRFHILNFLNDLKAGIFGLSFGDQAQFFKRKEIMDNRLFPNIPLMEDVELCLRLSLLGRHEYLFQKSPVSARRWKIKSLKNSFSIVTRVLYYLILRIFKTPDTVSMYYDYYGDGK